MTFWDYGFQTWWGMRPGWVDVDWPTSYFVVQVWWDKQRVAQGWWQVWSVSQRTWWCRPACYSWHQVWACRTIPTRSASSTTHRRVSYVSAAQTWPSWAEQSLMQTTLPPLPRSSKLSSGMLIWSESPSKVVQQVRGFWFWKWVYQ